MAVIVMAVAFTLPTWPRRHRPVRNGHAASPSGAVATPALDHIRRPDPAPRPDDLAR
jgi:hypothetical protein